MQVTIDAGAIWGGLGALAGAITTWSVIWIWIVRPARKVLIWLTEFREDWAGVPDRPGVKGRPGMMVRMAMIEAEFSPNGGNSMRDRVDLIERRQAEHDRAHAAASVAVATTLGVMESGNGAREAP